MNIITLRSFFVALMIAFVGNASAVTVTASIVPGKSVGMCNLGYCAGIVTLDINGIEYPAMLADWDYGTTDLTWYTDSTPFVGDLYTYDEVRAGANLPLSPAQYSLVAPILLDGVTFGYALNDPLYSAGSVERIWSEISGIGFWGYANGEYAGSGLTLLDIFNANPLTQDPNFDYSLFMAHLLDPNDISRNFTVFTSAIPMPSVPIPPSVWLFGTGLLGIVGIARRKATQRRL